MDGLRERRTAPLNVEVVIDESIVIGMPDGEQFVIGADCADAYGGFCRAWISLRRLAEER